LGILYSKGEYILFLDSDQRLSKETLKECVETCVRVRVDAVKIPEVFTGENFWGKCSALWKNTMIKAWGDEGGIPRFYRADILTRNGGFRKDLNFWEDLDLYERLRMEKIKTAWCSGLIIHHENGDLKEITRKYFSYGLSSTALKNKSIKINLHKTSILTLKTLMFLLEKPKKPLEIYLGTFVITAIKALSFFLGLLSHIH